MLPRLTWCQRAGWAKGKGFAVAHYAPHEKINRPKGLRRGWRWVKLEVYDPNREY